jgi:hypothetical protein
VQQAGPGVVDQGPDDPRLEAEVTGPEIDHRQRDHEQAELEHVEADPAAKDAAQSHHRAAAFEGPPVGEHRRHAGQQHESLGGVAEAEVVHGDEAEHVRRNVIDENHQQREAAQHIDAVIAFSDSCGRGHERESR